MEDQEEEALIVVVVPPSQWIRAGNNNETVFWVAFLLLATCALSPAAFLNLPRLAWENVAWLQVRMIPPHIAYYLLWLWEALLIAFGRSRECIHSGAVIGGDISNVAAWEGRRMMKIGNVGRSNTLLLKSIMPN